MSIINEIGTRIIFVTRNEKLVGSLSDGDIRRFILKKGDLNSPIKNAINYSPFFIFNYEKIDSETVFKKLGVDVIPIVDESMKIVDILIRYSNQNKEIHNPIKNPVVIMAGGLGTRLYPYTKILPKPLIPIGDTPIVEHIINGFEKYGVKKFFLIVNHKKNIIKAYFSEVRTKSEINLIDEDLPLGTGGGLSLLKDIISETFILSNCDILVTEGIDKIVEYHEQNHNYITMVCSVKTFIIPYGVIDIKENGQINSMKEKPELSYLVNTGLYVVNHKVIDEIEKNKYISFPEIITYFINQNRKIGIYPISEQQWFDIGEVDGMNKMINGMKKNE
jgi:dTDP-glucose pyrophosphorylase